jgi:2,3-bisphosphoglycerate-dependent phosphoglycerate mutase
MKKLYIIRHGESLDDIEDRHGGFANYHLTEKGKAQAKELAKNLRNSDIEIVFSSPYLRAWETAEFLAKELDVSLEIDKDIRERNTYGFLSGMKKEMSKKLFPDEVAKTKDPVTADKVDGSESLAEVKSRLEDFIQKINGSNHDVIAMVCHGKVIDILLTYILQLETKYKFGDCAYMVMGLDVSPRVLELNGVKEKE